MGAALRQVYEAVAVACAAHAPHAPSSSSSSSASSAPYEAWAGAYFSAPPASAGEDVADPAARLLAAAVAAPPAPAPAPTASEAAAGALDGLAATQPQLALAAEQGRGFLVALLTFPAVQAHLLAEEAEHDGRDPLWAIVAEAGARPTPPRPTPPPLRRRLFHPPRLQTTSRPYKN